MSARPSLPWAWPSARPLSRLWKDAPPRSWSMVAARLGAVGLVGNDRKAFALDGGQLADGFQGEGEGLDGANDDLLVAREGSRQFAALAAVVAGDGGHHAAGALEIEERLLELRVDDRAVRDHQDRIEDLFGLGIVQLGEEVGGPGNGVGLAGAGG